MPTATLAARPSTIEPTRAFPKKSGRKAIQITLLIGPGGDKLYGTDTPHGRLWKPTNADLLKAVRFIYGRRVVEVVDTWLASY